MYLLKINSTAKPFTVVKSAVFKLVKIPISIVVSGPEYSAITLAGSDALTTFKLDVVPPNKIYPSELVATFTIGIFNVSLLEEV
jgi:hypothetical protein